MSSHLVEKLELPTIETIKLQLAGFTGQSAERDYDLVHLSVQLGTRCKRITAVVVNRLPGNIQTPGLR